MPIPGATQASLTLNPVRATDAGSYTVVVSNAHGSATSQPAVLTINTATDRPRFTEFRFVPREGFRVRWTAPAGQRYVLEASLDLRTWVEVTTLNNPTGTVEFTDAEAVFIPRSYTQRRK